VSGAVFHVYMDMLWAHGQLVVWNGRKYILIGDERRPFPVSYNFLPENEIYYLYGVFK
jgi:hypothetical protein